jgi:uncharacterized protein (TIGR02145 family)
MNNKLTLISVALLSLTICTTSFTFFKTNNIETSSIIKKEITDEVKIGKQIWMSKNLDVTTFSNGETIEEAKDSKAWRKAGKEGRPAWCYYMIKEENGKLYGKIYNWFAVNDPRGLAPKGWRVPSIADWETLVEALGGESVAAPKMKSTYDWGGNTNGDNSSGFNGLPGGHQIHADGIFTNLHADAYWWTSTESNDKMACYFNLSHNNKIYYNSTTSKYKNSHAKKTFRIVC